MSAQTILIVDDDRIFAKALGNMLGNSGYTALVSFDTTEALLLARNNQVDCAIIDYNLGAVLGTALMSRLREEGHEFPVIILTGFGDIPTATRAMQLGASDFLEKPHKPETLIAALERAISRARDRAGSVESIREARQQLRVLTPRESEIVDAIVAGRTTKQISEVLGVSQRTIDAHRASIFQKLGISSAAELVRLAVLASLARPQD
ncbi:MAG: response regulator [Alphaproteobacteria bacterium]|uniref:response regulator transcription factor n=1 Tax=Aestuariivirga sp. TaxID=2650926 RepID=UPI0030180D82|nr:response regulator [Alphaproteobacteria bacterium]